MATFSAPLLFDCLSHPQGEKKQKGTQSTSSYSSRLDHELRQVHCMQVFVGLRRIRAFAGPFLIVRAEMAQVFTRGHLCSSVIMPLAGAAYKNCIGPSRRRLSSR